MLKVGDKLLGKKMAHDFYFNNFDKDFIKDDYIIVKIDGKTLNICNDGINVCFSFDDQYYPYIWYYFYSPQEVRKLKLEELKR